MTYIDYINDFNRWAEDDNPTDKAIILYYAMLDMFNRRGWPRWAGVDTQRLMLMARTANKQVAFRARDFLAQKGFIEYTPGRKGKASEYRLLKYCSKNDTENDTKSDTENDTKNDTKSGTPNKTKTKTKKEKNSLSESKKRSFVPPTVEEVRAYCDQNGKQHIDPEKFVSFYASKGWMVGKNKMVSWHSAVATWERREEDNGGRVNGAVEPEGRGEAVNWNERFTASDDIPDDWKR